MRLKKIVSELEDRSKEFFIENKAVIIWTAVITVITHIYFYMGRYGNEDSRFRINEEVSIFSSGRFFYGHTKFDFAPSIIFVLTIIEIICVSLLVISIFKIKNKLYSVIISGFIATFPVLGHSLAYIQLYDSYTLALLFSVLAVYCADRRKYGFLAGGVFTSLALALYQAYIAVSMGIALIILILELFEKDLKSVVYKGIRFLAFGIIGFILYKAGISVFGIELSDYKGIDSMGVIPIEKIPELIAKTYSGFIDFFTAVDPDATRIKFIYIPVVIFIAYIIFFIIFFIIFAKQIKKSEIKIINKVFIILGIFLLPLAVNFVDFIVIESGTYVVSAYAFVLMFIIPIVFMDKYLRFDETGKGVNKKVKFFWTKRVMIILCAVIIGYNFWATNLLYFKMDVVKTYTVGFFNRVYSRIEQLEGFDLKTPIAFIVDGKRFMGKTTEDDYNVFPNTKTNTMIRYNVIGGMAEGLHKKAAYATYKNSVFIKNLLGIDIVRANDEQIEEIRKTDEYKSMGVYPAHDSVKMINGIAAVNFVEQEGN